MPLRAIHEYKNALSTVMYYMLNSKAQNISQWQALVTAKKNKITGCPMYFSSSIVVRK